MDFFEIVASHPGWAKLASTMVKESVSKAELKEVFKHLKTRTVNSLRKNKAELITKGIGAGAGAGVGYVVSKKWKGKPSIEQRMANSQLKALSNREKKLKSKGKEPGLAHDTAALVARTHKDASNLMAKYPIRAGATQAAILGASVAPIVKRVIKGLAE